MISSMDLFLRRDWGGGCMVVLAWVWPADWVVVLGPAAGVWAVVVDVPKRLPAGAVVAGVPVPAAGAGEAGLPKRPPAGAVGEAVPAGFAGAAPKRLPDAGADEAGAEPKRDGVAEALDAGAAVDGVALFAAGAAPNRLPGGGADEAAEAAGVEPKRLLVAGLEVGAVPKRDGAAEEGAAAGVVELAGAPPKRPIPGGLAAGVVEPAGAPKREPAGLSAGLGLKRGGVDVVFEVWAPNRPPEVGAAESAGLGLKRPPAGGAEEAPVLPLNNPPWGFWAWPACCCPKSPEPVVVFCCPPNDGVFPLFAGAGTDPKSPLLPPVLPVFAPPNNPGFDPPAGGGPAGVVEALNNPPPPPGAGVEAPNVGPVFPPKEGLFAAAAPPKTPPEAGAGVADPAAPNIPEPPVFCCPPNVEPEVPVDGAPKRGAPAGLGAVEVLPKRLLEAGVDPLANGKPVPLPVPLPLPPPKRLPEEPAVPPKRLLEGALDVGWLDIVDGRVDTCWDAVLRRRGRRGLRVKTLGQSGAAIA